MILQKNTHHYKTTALALGLVVLFAFTSYAQSVSGKLTFLTNQEIRLEGFNGLQNYPIAAAQTDAQGNFTLTYTANDFGVGYLIANDDKPFYVILSGEDIEIVGEALSNPQTIRITKGIENQLFEQYASEHPVREQALSAWMYLEKMYQIDPLFSMQQTPAQAIAKEKSRLKTEDVSFLNALPKDSYVSWFLPTRKLVSSVSVIAQYRTEEIPATIAALRALDYTDNRLYKSGLFKDAIDSHFWLLENSGKSLDSVFLEMQLSIDALLENLVTNEEKLNEVTDYLFNLLERHSLFKASEYLAIKVLNEVSCTVNSDLAFQLETYRVMKKGNTAPDINFPHRVHPNTDFKPTKLSDYTTPYTLVVFGSSTCHKCQEEIPEIANSYSTWRNNGVDVLFVSLDKEKSNFLKFAEPFPFTSVCDLQGWDSPIAKDYYVFGTPTMYLLDNNRKIILRPNSVNQMDAWVDWYLVKGNPLQK